MSKLDSYCDLEKTIKDLKYAKEKNIIVKKGNNLNILKYNKNALNSSNVHTLGWFRSVIVNDKEILGMAPPKSASFELIQLNFKEPECYAEEFVEGTMINCFYDYQNDKWEIATRSNIGANCRFNNHKTFREMFFEAAEAKGFTFDLLEKDYSYSFVLQHPENRIVVPFDKADLVLVEIFDIPKIRAWYNMNGTYTTIIKNKNDKEFENLLKIIRIPQKLALTNWQSLINLYSNCDYKTVGCIIKTKDSFKRTKIRNKNYEYIRRLKGNSTKLQFQYYSLRKLKKIQEFLKFYPEYTKDFDEYKDVLYAWTEELYRNYRGCYVKKEKPLKEYPFPFRIHMYNLHQIYLQYLRHQKLWVDKNTVKNHINSLDPASLMYIINFKDKANNNNSV